MKDIKKMSGKLSAKGAKVLLAGCLACLPCAGLAGCGSEESASDAGTESAQTAAEEQASVTSHGSKREKSETVKVKTNLAGEVTAVAVDEWLKNPKGEKTVKDKSTLQQIEADADEVSFTQNGDELTWKTGGEDVHYSGVTDQELPFSVDYSYKLNGKKIDPGELSDVTGKLKVTIKYKNKTSGKVNVDGVDYDVQQPYAFASLMSFDAEHARNVKVDNGQVMDQEGSFIAVGLAMPGLAKTLGIEKVAQLPESVTVTADVVGFDMPSITTMGTNQALGMIGGKADDVQDGVEELFDKVAAVTEGVSKLEQGTAGISTALEQINTGQAKLGEALPKAADGLGKLPAAAAGIGDMTTGAQGSLTAIDDAASAATDELAKLEAIDKAGMSEEQKKALEDATAALKVDIASIRQRAQAANAILGSATAVSGQLSDGLEGVTAGISQISAGYAKLEEATGKVSEASSKLHSGVEAMSSSVESALSKARGSIDEKLNLIAALSDYVDEQGAFCGNAAGMPASTTFIVTAKAD